MIKIDKVIVVEGRYDKIKLSSMIDGIIIETEGFGIFKDKDKQKLIRNRLRMAKPSLHPPKQRLPTEKLRLRRIAVN